jgi:hypothetical protein
VAGIAVIATVENATDGEGNRRRGKKRSVPTEPQSTEPQSPFFRPGKLPRRQHEVRPVNVAGGESGWHVGPGHVFASLNAGLQGKPGTEGRTLTEGAYGMSREVWDAAAPSPSLEAARMPSPEDAAPSPSSEAAATPEAAAPSPSPDAAAPSPSSEAVAPSPSPYGVENEVNRRRLQRRPDVERFGRAKSAKTVHASAFNGVRWNKSRKEWLVAALLDGKKVTYVGAFAGTPAGEVEAALAYDVAARAASLPNRANFEPVETLTGPAAPRVCATAGCNRGYRHGPRSPGVVKRP